MDKDKQKIKELENEKQKLKWKSFKEKCQLLSALREKLGDSVEKAFKEHRYEQTKKSWSEIAEKKGSNTIKDLLEVLWEPMKNEFNFTIEEKNGGVQIYCTYCPLAEMAKKLNETKWGFQFYCMEDYAIVDGFNPKIGFKRTKTLMEGHVYCDHFYYLKD